MDCKKLRIECESQVKKSIMGNITSIGDLDSGIGTSPLIVKLGTLDVVFIRL